MVVTKSSRVRPGQAVHAREFDGEVILVDLEGGDYFGLDEVGGRVWLELGRGLSVAEIASLLVKEYDVKEDQLLLDVIDLLNRLAEHGLVVERT